MGKGQSVFSIPVFLSGNSHSLTRGTVSRRNHSSLEEGIRLGRVRVPGFIDDEAFSHFTGFSLR